MEKLRLITLSIAIVLLVFNGTLIIAEKYNVLINLFTIIFCIFSTLIEIFRNDKCSILWGLTSLIFIYILYINF